MLIQKFNKSHNINEILKIDLEAVEEFYDLIKDIYSQEELLNIETTHRELKGEYFLGSIDNQIVALCGYKIINNNTVQLRRFRVLKKLRYNGLGSQLIQYDE